MEIRPEEFSNINVGDRVHQSIYIIEAVDLFKKYFRFKMGEKKPYVHSSQEYPNIRFHYLDLRLHYVNGLNSWDLEREMYEINNNRKYKWNEQLNSMLSKYMTIPQTWIKLVNFKTLNIENMDMYGKMFFKLRNTYSDKNNKMIINKILDSQVITNYNNTIKSVDKLKKEIDKEYEKETNKFFSNDRVYLKRTEKCGFGITTENIISIRNKIDKVTVDDILYGISCPLMDLYTVRRIVDKEYIKNAIVYTGSYHSCEIIYYLVKYFDFEVTNCFYSEMKMDELNKHIKGLKEFDWCKDFYVIEPEYLTQCSNMKGFPDLFI